MSTETTTGRKPNYWFGDGTTKMPVTTAVMLIANNKPTTISGDVHQDLGHELFVLGQYVFDDLRFTKPPREEGERRLAAIDAFSEYIMDCVELDNNY